MPGVTCTVRGVPGVLRPERAADRSGASAGAGVGRSREDQTTTEDGRVGRGREFQFGVTFPVMGGTSRRKRKHGISDGRVGIPGLGGWEIRFGVSWGRKPHHISGSFGSDSDKLEIEDGRVGILLGFRGPGSPSSCSGWPWRPPDPSNETPHGRPPRSRSSSSPACPAAPRGLGRKRLPSETARMESPVFGVEHTDSESPGA